MFASNCCSGCYNVHNGIQFFNISVSGLIRCSSFSANISSFSISAEMYDTFDAVGSLVHEHEHRMLDTIVVHIWHKIFD